MPPIQADILASLHERILLDLTGGLGVYDGLTFF